MISNGLTLVTVCRHSRAARAFVLLGLALASPAMAAEWIVSSASQFESATVTYAPGDIITLRPGTYNLSRIVGFSRGAVTVRGQSGSYADVTLYGGGMNNTSAIREALQIYSDNVTIQDITVSGFYHHAIHFMTDADYSLIHNVHTLNIGDQHMKGAVPNRNGIIEQCFMEQTTARLNGLGGRPDNYVGGIDLHGAVNFQIRDNVAKGVNGLNGGDAGIFLWNGSKDCVIERNTIVGCRKGIALGNPSSQNKYQAENCIVRNNFVVRDYGNDIGIEICYTRSCNVLNNTVVSLPTTDGGNFNRTFHIYDSAALGFQTTNLLIAYNIIRGNILDNSTGPFTLVGNITGTTPQLSWFFNATGGDLHLTASAGAAVGTGAQQLMVAFDFDGQLRGPLPDVGADQRTVWLAGDANGDRVVDVRDLAILAVNYDAASGKYWSEGDFTGDTGTDVQDLAMLAFNYNRTMPPVALVPEPACLALLPLLCLLRGRRPRRLAEQTHRLAAPVEVVA